MYTDKNLALGGWVQSHPQLTTSPAAMPCTYNHGPVYNTLPFHPWKEQEKNK